MKIGYIAFGALGEQIAGYVREQHGAHHEELFFDDLLWKAGSSQARPFNEYSDPQYHHIHQWYVCLGYRYLGLKLKIVRQLISEGRKLPNLVHPSCFVHRTAKIGAATYLYPMCNVDSGVTLGDGVVLNNSVIVSHDSTVGAGSFLSPGVVVTGKVQVGEEVFVGAGSVVSNACRVGNGVVVGFASAVGGDVATGSHVIGNPLRVLKAPLEL